MNMRTFVFLSACSLYFCASPSFAHSVVMPGTVCAWNDRAITLCDARGKCDAYTTLEFAVRAATQLRGNVSITACRAVSTPELLIGAGLYDFLDIDLYRGGEIDLLWFDGASNVSITNVDALNIWVLHSTDVEINGVGGSAVVQTWYSGVVLLSGAFDHLIIGTNDNSSGPPTTVVPYAVYGEDATFSTVDVPPISLTYGPNYEDVGPDWVCSDDIGGCLTHTITQFE